MKQLQEAFPEAKWYPRWNKLMIGEIAVFGDETGYRIQSPKFIGVLHCDTAEDAVNDIKELRRIK